MFEENENFEGPTAEAERAAWRQVVQQCFESWSRAPERERHLHLLTGPALAWAELELLSRPDQNTLRYRLFLTQSQSQEERELNMPTFEASQLGPEGRRVTGGLVASILLACFALGPIMYWGSERLATNRRLAQVPPTNVQISDIAAQPTSEPSALSQPPGLIEGEPTRSPAEAARTEVAEVPATSPAEPASTPDRVEVVEAPPAAEDPALVRQRTRDRIRGIIAGLVPLIGHSPNSTVEVEQLPDATVDAAEKLLSDTVSSKPGWDVRIATLLTRLGASIPLLAPRDGAAPSFAVRHAEFCAGAKSVVSLAGNRELIVRDLASGAGSTIRDIGIPGGQEPTLDRDCRRLARASEDYRVEIVSVATTERISELVGHDAQITGFTFDITGHRIVTTSRDGTARLWNAGTGRLLSTLRGHEGPVMGARFDSSGERIATWSEDRTARIWDAASGRHQLTLDGHNGAVTGAQFTASGRHLITTSMDGFARIWQTRDGKVEIVQVKGSSIVRAVLGRDGRALAVMTPSSVVEVWNIEAGVMIARLDAQPEPLRDVSFGPDSSSLALVTWTGRIGIWEPQSGRKLTDLEQPGKVILAAGYDPSGSTIRALTQDAVLMAWPSPAAVSAVIDAARAGH